MKVTCLMMQKNEYYLLEPWILYHGFHFGLENLFVYDNGSDNKNNIKTLKKYEALGLNVNWKLSKKIDFENKGYIFSEKIKSLDSTSPSDFYFPMDCDEFIVVEGSKGEVSVDTFSIINELKKYEAYSSPLAIGTAYDNNPMVPEYYYRASGQKKTFFTRNTCWTLDLGFHDGKTKSGEAPNKTNIAYVHYHYKSFEQYAQSALQKLENRVDDLSKKSLEVFATKKLAGFHLVGALLGGRDKYYQGHYNRYKKQVNAFYKLYWFNDLVSRFGLEVDAVNSNLSEAFNKNIPRWKGYIDSIHIQEKGIELIGWIVTLYDFDLKSVILDVSGKKYRLTSLVRYARKDVEDSVQYSRSDSGVKMFFSTKEIPNINDADDISIYIDDYGTRFDFSFSGNLLY